MNITDLKEKISDVLSVENCSAEFYFLIKDGDEINIRFVDIKDEDQEELSKSFVNSINNSFLLNDDLSLIPLSSADDRKNAIYEYDIEELPNELSHLAEVISNDDYNSFDFSSDSLANLKGILVLIGDDEKQLSIYKHQYPVALIKKSSGIKILRSSGTSRFEKLNDDILSINPKFEFFCVDGKYYIQDLKALERFFGFHDAVKNVAMEGIENIEESGLIENPGVLSERVDDISFSRKLVKVARSSPVIGSIPNEQIIEFTKTHPALKGKFKYSSDEDQLFLKTKSSQNLFLKLLNDDFLQSELTRRYYDSIAKDGIEV